MMVCCNLCHPYCHIAPMHAYGHSCALRAAIVLGENLHSDQCEAGSIRKGINKLLVANTADGAMLVTQLTLSISTSKLRTSKKTWAWRRVRPPRNHKRCLYASAFWLVSIFLRFCEHVSVLIPCLEAQQQQQQLRLCEAQQ